MTRSLSDSFGLIAQLASTRITLPLTRVETRFRVTGDVALVEIDQVFVQNARRSLDVTCTKTTSWRRSGRRRSCSVRPC